MHTIYALLFYIGLIMSIVASLCPNIIEYVDVAFSKCRSEEMISLCWFSVYIK